MKDGPILFPADHELVQRVLAGDGRALEEFLERARCIPRILHFKNHRLSHPLPASDMADLAQETFARIWARLDRYLGTGSLEAWMYRFCCNVLVRALEHASSGRAQALGEVASEEATTHHHHGSGTWAGERIERTIGALPEAYEAVVRLKLLSEMTFQELAGRLGIPVNTAKTRYYRGMEQVRRALGTEPIEELRE